MDARQFELLDEVLDRVLALRFTLGSVLDQPIDPKALGEAVDAALARDEPYQAARKAVAEPLSSLMAAAKDEGLSKTALAYEAASNACTGAAMDVAFRVGFDLALTAATTRQP